MWLYSGRGPQRSLELDCSTGEYGQTMFEEWMWGPGKAQSLSALHLEWLAQAWMDTRSEASQQIEDKFVAGENRHAHQPRLWMKMWKIWIVLSEAAQKEPVGDCRQGWFGQKTRG